MTDIDQKCALVTGVAGFIGSHLAERLLADGWRVVGVDALTPYYGADVKKSNLEVVAADPGFTWLEQDLLDVDAQALLADADVVFHLAGQPGVRGSWAGGFAEYVRTNVEVTQRLLEAARATGAPRFVFASSSSVYGDVDEFPCREDALPLPHSPYGVTKLAAEHLCRLYAANWGVPTVSLRYFSVYGPRQRPDMAAHRLIEAALSGEAFPLFGSGDQVRDMTFVLDVVEATVAAATLPVPPGMVMNVAGGSAASLRDMMRLVEDLTGERIIIDERPSAAGDVRVSSGATDVAVSTLGWRPETSLEQGLASQVEWHVARRSVADVSAGA